MSVLTLGPEAFAEACGRLRGEVEASGFRPDLVVGIARGGVFVMDAAYPPGEDGVRRMVVRRQRPSTGRKSGLRNMLRRLPRWLADIMRIAEALLLELKSRRKSRGLDESGESEKLELLESAEKSEAGNPSEKPGLLGQLGGLESIDRVLILDDAVDSGETVAVVAGAIKRNRPNAEVRVAVITQTRPHPLIRPDYALWRNRTLVRFPWSLDYHA